MTGRFIAIVGPSGVGKDSVMSALAADYDGYVLARRVITRAPDAGGEDFESVTLPEFQRRMDAGAFVLHWQAHGLRYGIARNILADLDTGHDVLANLSRSMLPEALKLFPQGRIVLLTASAAALAHRLTERGRESAAEITARLAQATRGIPEGLDVTILQNDGALSQTVAALHRSLQAERAARCI